LNWIISELFYPDEVSTAQILTDIALKKLDKSEVNILCGPAGYEKYYSSQKKVLDSRIKIFRVGLPSLDKNKLFQRALRLILLTIKMSWFILFKVQKNDHVLITTNPTFLLIAVSLIKNLKGFYLEILVHDVFPENLVPAGLIKKDGFQFKFLSRIYNNSYRNADRIIVLGEDMKMLFQQKISNKNIKIDVIPNWSDNDISPLHDFNISEYLGIDVNNKIVIGFAGNLGRLQGVLEFIDLFSKSGNLNIVLIIIGDGALKFPLIDKLKNENILNVYYLGPKGRNEQIFFLNACHIGLVTLINGMSGLGVPSKTYNLMAAAKPILYFGDQNSEIDKYIKKFDCGWSFSWANEVEIINFFKNLSLKYLPKISEKGFKSKFASENFQKDKVLNLF
jgi:glycosyltransferase involved in cell wall biosynthesis